MLVVLFPVLPIVLLQYNHICFHSKALAPQETVFLWGFFGLRSRSFWLPPVRSPRVRANSILEYPILVSFLPSRKLGQ